VVLSIMFVSDCILSNMKHHIEVSEKENLRAMRGGPKAYAKKQGGIIHPAQANYRGVASAERSGP
jgi:hypothetical protein